MISSRCRTRGMEIFIGSSPDHNMVREAFLVAVQEAWMALGSDPFCKYTTFRSRWEWAERESKTPVYVLADDDCLPHPKTDIPRILRLFDTHPDYGMLAMNNILEIPPGRADDEGVIESWGVGGIRFIRKGIVTEFPDSFDGDDMKYYWLMKDKGFKSGYVAWAQMLHLGIWHSQWANRLSAKAPVAGR